MLGSTNASKPTRPWVSNVQYTLLKYPELRKAVFSRESTRAIRLGTTREYRNVAAMFEELGSTDADYRIGSAIPYVTGVESKFNVWSEDCLFRICVKLCARGPYLAIEPVVVLPEEGTVYQLSVRIDALFFKVRRAILLRTALYSADLMI